MTTKRKAEPRFDNEVDIVVTIPAARLAAVEEEERRVADLITRGEKGWGFYWAMGRLPIVTPRRIYFLWNGAVRAYHDVKYMDDYGQSGGPEIVMWPRINEVEPIPMRPFRGFRYFSSEGD